MDEMEADGKWGEGVEEKLLEGRKETRIRVGVIQGKGGGLNERNLFSPMLQRNLIDYMKPKG